ncbi:MAG: PAS domain S-box protein [Campylobacterales bacterium]
MNKFSLAKLLYICLFGGVITILSLSGFAAWQSWQARAITEKAFNHPFTVSNTARDIRVDIRALWENMESHVYKDGEGALSDAEARAIDEKINNEIKILKTRFLGSQSDVEDIEREYKKLKIVINEVVRLASQEGSRTAIAHMDELKAEKLHRDLSKEIDDIVEFAKNKAQELKNASDELNQKQANELFVFSVFIFVAVSIAGLILTKYINGEFEKISNAIKRIENGHYDSLGLGTGGLKEFCDIKNTVSKMALSIKDSKEVIEQQNEEALAHNEDLINQARELEELNAEFESSNEILRKTELHLTELLREQNALLKVKTAGFLHVKDRKFIWVNEGIARMLDYEVDEMIGQDARMVYMSDGDYERYGRQIYEAISDNKTCEIEINARKKDGSSIWVLASFTPLENAPSEAIGVILDISNAKNLTETLRNERRRYKTIMKYSSDGIFIMKLDGSLVECSEQAAKMLGYTKEEMSNLRISDWDSGISADEIAALVGSLSEKPITFETKHKRKDGSVYDAEITATAIWIDEYKYIYAAVRDVTEAKESKAKLKKLIEEQAAMLNARSIGFVHACNRRYIWTNEAFERMLGYNAGELQGKGAKEVMHPDDYEEYGRRAYDELRRTGSFTGEARYIKKDGSMVWLMTNMSLLRPDSTDMIGAAFDITEQKLAELELKKLYEEQQAILKAKTTGFAHLKNRKFFWINETMASMLGYTQEELQGQSTKVMYDSDEEYEKYGWEGYAELEKKGTFTKEIKCRKKDGSVMWMLLAMTTVDAKSKEAIGVAIDITRQKELEDNLSMLVDDEVAKNRDKDMILQRQSRLASMGEMISNIAHQWRQPLNALAMRVQDVPLAVQFDEMNLDYATNFKMESMDLIRYMSQTIDDFRNFFKPDKEKKEFDLKDSITKANAIVKDGMKSSFIDIILELPQEELNIFGYPSEFSQVLINILNNAKDALNEHKKDGDKHIKIAAYKRSAEIVVSVTDNAGGVPESIMDKIFDPYFSTKSASQGTGLGLYMSKMIIEQNMGGKLSVHNTGDGACFEMVFDSKTI